MTLLKNISKVTYSLIIICFFLPFIVEQCSGLEKKNSSDMADSISVSPRTFLSDTSDTEYDEVYDSSGSQQDSVFVQSDTLIPPKEETHRSFLEKLVSPDGKHLSGVGFIIVYYKYILVFSSIPTALILAVICLVRRSFRKYHNDRKTLIYTLTGLGSLVIIFLLHLSDLRELKIGYWLALVFYIITAALSYRIYLEWKKYKKVFHDNNY